MRGGIEETSASFEARYAPRSYPTGKRIVEGPAICLEAHAMPQDILRRFGVVPFEVIVFHNTTT